MNNRRIRNKKVSGMQAWIAQNRIGVDSTKRLSNSLVLLSKEKFEKSD
jgi:hypothetical protein